MCHTEEIRMSELVRFGVSIESDLLGRFDTLVERQGHANRSEAVRDLIRARLSGEQVTRDDARAMGVLSLVYDHHTRDLERRLTDFQHQHHDAVIAVTHAHVDHDRCLEVILLRGAAGRLRALAAALGGLKGVLHSDLVLTAASASSHTHH
jgi:CopG family transcriptional regulator, nickel-responsive regulator